MEFRVLGPLAVVDGACLLDLGSRRQRLLLAVLLCRASELVSVDALVDAVWGATPPASAVDNVYVYVSRLRKALGAERITGRAGYVLQCIRHELDAYRFADLATSGRAALEAGDPGLATDRLREALSLWRGCPFSGLDEPALAGETVRLQEQRMLAVEDRIDAELALGEDAGLVGELTVLAAEHPYRERLRAALMLALYRSGRQADALQAYQAARKATVGDLGVEPGPRLQQLHQAILCSDPALQPAPSATGPVPRPAGNSPGQLPAAVSGFVGRVDDLTRLEKMTAGPAAAAVITTIAGTAGVGKTALAVHWGRQAADRFPDGQLYVDLRGFGPHPPLQPVQVLGQFLRALGTRPEDLPPTEAESAALYRSRLAGRRMLILLDNAATAEQVRPLLPGYPGCVVIVTSRDRLTGLVSLDGARRLSLDVLPPDDAYDLLRQLLGADRADPERDAAAALADACGYLPLALRIAAANLGDNPARPIADYLTELGLPDGLDALEVIGDEERAVRRAFDHSYQRISTDAQRLFRLLGLMPGYDIGVHGAAALADLTPQVAARLLNGLAAAHLLAEHAGRYTFHDLLRLYATELATTHDEARDRAAALQRLLDYYLHTGVTACLLLPAHCGLLPPLPPDARAQPMVDRGEALAWFNDEHPALLAALDRAAAVGLDSHVWQLAWILTTFFNRHGQWQDLLAAHTTALSAARRAGDRSGQVSAHGGIGQALIQLGQFDRAHTHLREALAYSEDLGPAATAGIHLEIGKLLNMQGRDEEAVVHSRRALSLFRAADDTVGQASALSELGWQRAMLGEYKLALADCQRALVQHRQLGNSPAEAATLDTIGFAHHHLGDYDAAIPYYMQSVDLMRELDNRPAAAEVLGHLGDAYSAAGEHRAARQARQQAVDILEALGHPDSHRVRKLLELSRR